MGEIHNKIVLTERVRTLEADVKALKVSDEKDNESLIRILNQQDKIIGILEEIGKLLKDLTDGEAYHKWLNPISATSSVEEGGLSHHRHHR